jgi:uncharacterized protein (DUF1778 family)
MKKSKDALSRLEIRLPKSIKDTIKYASELRGLTLSAFVINSAMESAEKIMEKRNQQNVSSDS